MCLLRNWCNNYYVMITYESLRNRLNSNYAFYTSKCSFLKCFKSAKIAASQKTLGSPSSFPILPPFSFCEPVCTSFWTGFWTSLWTGANLFHQRDWLGQGMLYLFPIGWMTAAHATWSYDVIMADHVDGHLIVGLFHFIL